MNARPRQTDGDQNRVGGNSSDDLIVGDTVASSGQAEILRAWHRRDIVVDSTAHYGAFHSRARRATATVVTTTGDDIVVKRRIVASSSSARRALSFSISSAFLLLRRNQEKLLALQSRVNKGCGLIISAPRRVISM